MLLKRKRETRPKRPLLNVALALAVAMLVAGAYVASQHDGAAIPVLSEKQTPTVPFKTSTQDPDPRANETILLAYRDAILESCEPARAITPSEDEIERRTDELVSDVLNLRHSNSADLLHFTALFQRDSAQAVTDIQAALRLTPNDPFVVHTAARLCARAATGSCDQGDLLKRLVALDSESRSTWTQVALFEYRNGQPEKAIEAIERATYASAPGYHFLDHVLLTLNAMQAIGKTDFGESVERSFGITAALAFPSVQEQIDMCKLLAASDERAANACLQLGRRMEQQGSDIVATAFGGAMQKTILELQGDTDAIDALKRRRDAENQRFSSAFSTGLMHFRHTPATFEHYVQAFRTNGELNALVETGRLLETVANRYPEVGCAGN